MNAYIASLKESIALQEKIINKQSKMIEVQNELIDSQKLMNVILTCENKRQKEIIDLQFKAIEDAFKSVKEMKGDNV